MTSFVSDISKKHNVKQDSILIKYLERKTKAVDRGSKARRSLGNLYALYVLCDAYIEGQVNGTKFTQLLSHMRELPFGSKLQNHPLDNRLNDEVKRQYDVSDGMLPVQAANLHDGSKARKISIPLLTECDDNPENAALFVIDVIDSYIEIISDNQIAYLDEIESADTVDSIVEVVSKSFAQNADARLFEIISYALLSLHFKERTVTITENEESTTMPLTLYRTGRTNANDGGIDFVLAPLGKFYQVTETLDFKKYFLDFDKINRFQLSFIIKTDLTADEVRQKIQHDASQLYSEEVVDRYTNLFDEIFTLSDLNEILQTIKESPDKVSELKQIVIDSFKLEYGMLD